MEYANNSIAGKFKKTDAKLKAKKVAKAAAKKKVKK